MRKIIKAQAGAQTGAQTFADGISNIMNQKLKTKIQTPNVGLNIASITPPDISKQLNSDLSSGKLQQMLNNSTKNVTSGTNDISGLLSGGSTLSGVNSLIDPIGNSILSFTGKEKSSLSSGLDQVGNLASMIPGWGQGVGIGLKVIGLANDIGSKSIKPVSITSGISGYSGSDLNYKGKTIGGISRLFGGESKEKNKLNALKQNAILAKANTKNQLNHITASNQSIFNTAKRTESNLSGANVSSLIAKNGAKLKNIIKFKNGGSVNVIPSGALHARKNNLDEVKPALKDDITLKGAPLISYAKEGDILEYEDDGKTPKKLAEGGEIVQHAEIEKDEVILHKSLTEKIEELMKDGSDEAAIEAGKLLSKELIENTIDNTGLTDKILNNEN